MRLAPVNSPACRVRADLQIAAIGSRSLFRAGGAGGRRRKSDMFDATTGITDLDAARNHMSARVSAVAPPPRQNSEVAPVAIEIKNLSLTFSAADTPVVALAD